MRHEWKKREKGIYGIKTESCVVDVPTQECITVFSSGNLNGETSLNKAMALFLVAYRIEMTYKALAEKGNGVTDCTIYPLEEIWGMIISVWGKNTVKYI